METEYFKIFDENDREMGVASRHDVHKFGYWHETFHCWFVTKHKDTNYIYLQLRSDLKADYPNLLDITVAGHLTANETVQDGVREIKEEVGVTIPFNHLEPLGTIKYCITKDQFIDKELAHIFLYKSKHSLNDFVVQSNEVSGIVIAKFEDFRELWFSERQTIEVSGFKIDGEGNRSMYAKNVGKNQFVPHPISFYQEVVNKIEVII